VRAARARALPIAVRGGGHSVPVMPSRRRFVVSLAAMRDVVIDPDARLAHAGGGALWNDVDAAAFARPRRPGGTFGDTGIGGLTLGGGIGWLMPVAGLTCDNLVEAEVVTRRRAGRHRRTGRSGLLWALRGGGGNFGVVTRFTYRLTPVAPMFGGRSRWPAARRRGPRSDRATRPTTRRRLPLVTIGRTGRRIHGHRPQYPIVDGADPGRSSTSSGDLPVIATTRTADLPRAPGRAGILPFGLRHYWKGHFPRSRRRLFARLVEASEADDCVPDAFVLLERMSGAGRSSHRADRVRPAGGTWNASAHRDLGGADARRHRHRLGASRRAMLEPASLTGGGYVNYSPVDETPDRVRAAYGDERWVRLVAVKRRYGPGQRLPLQPQHPARMIRWRRHPGRGRLDAARPRRAPVHADADERTAVRIAGAAAARLRDAQRGRNRFVWETQQRPIVLLSVGGYVAIAAMAILGRRRR
jgi:hypothetical protein